MQKPWLRLNPIVLILLTLPVWTGCDGCRRATPDDEAKLKDKRPAPVDEFTFGNATPLPSGGGSTLSAVKLGHWFSLRQSIRCNQGDQHGDLTFTTSIGTNTPTTASDEATGLICQRPAVLPKGRMKRLDVRLLASADRYAIPMKVSTSGKFNSRTTYVPASRLEHQTMLGNEYFFVILTSRPERFASFQAADWVRMPHDDEGTAAPANNYRIVFPRASGLMSLPETMLDWTSTGVVFWDDLSPSELTSEQRRALTDWLHFGGRMIVNGDSNVGDLANSEFGPLLPIEVKGMTDLDAGSTAELIENWSVKGDDSVATVSALVRSQASRVAIGGELARDAIYIDRTSELLTARRVGRGEIVMSRFDLTSDWLIGWRSRDSFFNAAVLARPGRDFAIESGRLIHRIAGDDERLFVATSGSRVNSSLRLTSRDARLTFVTSAIDPVQEPSFAQPQLGEFLAHPYSGLGGWRDDSDAARLLQSVLREQSGVNIPPRPFVIRSLAIYLAILVPANYLFFWLLGRLEWAWLAVPALALLGAGWIARTVSLDLGLARNHSEVSLIEVQPGYARGHVTRFGAIYNSLSGNYQIQFDSPDAAAAPIDIANKSRLGLPPCVFKYGYTDGPMLDNFAVPSNRTRIFHAEQVVDLGGSIEMLGDNVRNASALPLLDAIAFRKRDDGNLERAVLGEIDSGAKVRLNWTAIQSRPSVDALMLPFTNMENTASGSVRLVARVEAPLPGMSIQPETPRQTSSTVVLVHLTHSLQLRSRGDASLMPTRKEREKLLIDSGIDPSSVKEIIVP